MGVGMGVEALGTAGGQGVMYDEAEDGRHSGAVRLDVLAGEHREPQRCRVTGAPADEEPVGRRLHQSFA